MHRKPHVSKSRSTRSLQAAAANQAAAWSQDTQPRMNMLNQAASDLDQQPGSAIKTGAGSAQHPVTQPGMTDAAPVNAFLQRRVNESRLLNVEREESEPTTGGKALSASELQIANAGLLSHPQVHSAATHGSDAGDRDSKAHQMSDLGSATSRAWTELDSDLPDDLLEQQAGPHVPDAADAVSLASAARKLFQQSTIDSATDQLHVKRNSGEHKADRAWSWTGLWGHFWGEACPSSRLPSQSIGPCALHRCLASHSANRSHCFQLCFCQGPDCNTLQKHSAFTMLNSRCHERQLQLTSRTMQVTSRSSTHKSFFAPSCGRLASLSQHAYACHVSLSG